MFVHICVWITFLSSELNLWEVLPRPSATLLLRNKRSMRGNHSLGDPCSEGFLQVRWLPFTVLENLKLYIAHMCEIECKCVHLAMFKIWNRLENRPEIFLSPSSNACWERLIEQGGSCDTAAQIKSLAFVVKRSWSITDTSVTLLLLINCKWAWVLPVTSKPP